MGLAQSTPGHWTRRSPFFVAPSLPFSQRCDNPLENCVFFFWFCVCFVVFPPPPFFSFVHANKWTCSYGVAVEMLRWFDTSTAPRRRPTACDGRSEEHLRVECEKDKYGVFQWRETEISSRVCFSSSAPPPFLLLFFPSSFFTLSFIHLLLLICVLSLARSSSSASPSWWYWSVPCCAALFFYLALRRRRYNKTKKEPQLTFFSISRFSPRPFHPDNVQRWLKVDCDHFLSLSSPVAPLISLTFAGSARRAFINQ